MHFSNIGAPLITQPPPVNVCRFYWHTHTRNLGVKVRDDGSNFSFVFLPIFVAVVGDGYSSLLPIPVGGNGKIDKAIESLFLRGGKNQNSFI